MRGVHSRCIKAMEHGHGQEGPAGCGQFLETRVSLSQTPNLKFADSNGLREVKGNLLQQGQRPPPAPLPKW